MVRGFDNRTGSVITGASASVESVLLERRVID